MTDMLRARLKEHGSNDRPAAEVLCGLVYGHAKYEEYLQAVQNESATDSMGNTFQMLLINELGESDAETDLVSTFGSLITTDDDYGEN